MEEAGVLDSVRRSAARAICPTVAESSDHRRMVWTLDAARPRPSPSVGCCPAKSSCTQAASAQLKKMVIKDAPQYHRNTNSQVFDPQWRPPAGRMPNSANRNGMANAAAPIALRIGKTRSFLSLRSSLKLRDTRFHVMRKA